MSRTKIAITEHPTICKTYIQGKSCSQIAIKYNVNGSAINKILVKNKIKRRNISEASKLTYLQGRKAYMTKELAKRSKKRFKDKNHNWKGDEVGYYALHQWVRSRLVEPKFCPKCFKEKRLDLANISQEYKRELTDWEWLCRKCHMAKDGRTKNLKQYNDKPT